MRVSLAIRKKIQGPKKAGKAKEFFIHAFIEIGFLNNVDD